MELSHLDKVTFQSLYRLKVQTCSDNAPTVAPDKVPRNRRLRAGSFLREQQRVAAPSSRVAFACVSLAAAPTATPCFRHWRRSLQLQNPRFRPIEQSSPGPHFPVIRWRNYLPASRTENPRRCLCAVCGDFLHFSAAEKQCIIEAACVGKTRM